MSSGKNIIFYGVTILTLLLIGYVLFSVGRAAVAYENMISMGKGWSEGLYQADVELGYSLASNAIGYEILNGRRIPVETNAYGMRVKSGARLAEEGGKQKILFLGDSFTFGAAVDAEHTFSQIVAAESGMTAYNAGVPGYGVAHMIVQAGNLIPRIKPEIVVFQYSPWLIERAMSPFAAPGVGKIAQPYFSSDLKPHVEYPLAPNRLSGISISDHIENRPSMAGRVSFLLRHGLPAIVMLDVDSISLFFEGIPPPSTDAEKVTRHAYVRMAQIARDNGAIPIVLVMGSVQSLSIPLETFPQGVQVIDAQNSLIFSLAEKTAQAYAEAYWHWEGNPPALIDYHPNETAHNIVARALLVALRR